MSVLNGSGLPKVATGELVPKPTLAVAAASVTLVERVWLAASSVAGWLLGGPSCTDGPPAAGVTGVGVGAVRADEAGVVAAGLVLGAAGAAVEAAPGSRFRLDGRPPLTIAYGCWRSSALARPP